MRRRSAPTASRLLRALAAAHAAGRAGGRAGRPRSAASSSAGTATRPARSARWSRDDTATAQVLIDDVLDAVAGPVQVDLADRHLELLQGLVARGFLLQRPFTRMVHGAAAPGDPARVVLVAGPELG